MAVILVAKGIDGGNRFPYSAGRITARTTRLAGLLRWVLGLWQQADFRDALLAARAPALFRFRQHFHHRDALAVAEVYQGDRDQ